MLAVVIYFWRDLVRITRTWLSSLRRPELRGELDARMGWYVIIATIPIGVVGLAFNDQIENGARNLYLIGTILIVAGPGPRCSPSTWGGASRDVERRDAAPTRSGSGVAQALALVPGTSRSGATITAGLFLGMKREAAARFSFLLSIPADRAQRPLRPDRADHRRRRGELRRARDRDRLRLRLRLRRRSRSCCATWRPTPMLIFVVYRVVLGAVVIGAGRPPARSAERAAPPRRTRSRGPRAPARAAPHRRGGPGRTTRPRVDARLAGLQQRRAGPTSP